MWHLLPPDAADVVVCTGLFDDETETPETYRPMLERLAARGTPMICANPDVFVERGDRLVSCAWRHCAALPGARRQVDLCGQALCARLSARLRSCVLAARQACTEGSHPRHRRWSQDGSSGRRAGRHIKHFHRQRFARRSEAATSTTRCSRICSPATRIPHRGAARAPLVATRLHRLNRQHDLADVLARFHAPMRIGCRGQRKRRIHDHLDLARGKQRP